MTNADLNGKPYALNPHVWFDWVDVSSAKLGPVHCKSVIVAMTIAFIALSGWAESQYPNVAYGDTVTISESQARSDVTIAGKLIVTGGTTKPATVVFGSPAGEAQKTPAVIEVNGGRFGSSHGTTDPTTVNLGADGGRGQFVVKSGTLGVTVLNISASAAAGDDGYIDFARLEDGTARFRNITNNSSLTGRVTVAGNVTIGPDHGWYPTMHKKGATLYECADGITLTFDGDNCRAAVNEVNVPVRLRGNADVKFSIADKDAANFLTLQQGLSIETTGTLLFSGNGTYNISGSDIFGKDLTGIALEANTRLSFAAGKTNFAARVTAGNGARFSGSGVLLADVASGSKTFAVTTEGGLTLLKRGAGELVVDTTPQVSTLVLQDGTVRFVRDCVVSNVTVRAGTRLVADGAKVVLLKHPEELDVLETTNEGDFVFAIKTESGLDDVRRFAWRHELVKTGEGETRMYDPVLTGFVHVAEGRLSFSRLGLRDRYLKFTIKELLQFWYGGKYSPLAGMRARIYFYDVNGALCSDTTSYNTTFNLGTHPSSLTKGEVTAPSDTVWTKMGDYTDPFFMFRSSGGNPCRWLTGALTNAEDKVNFQVIYYRLPDPIAAEIDGINVNTPWDYGNPKAWMVESSTTGEDGTWQTILDKNERCAGMSSSNYGVMNGDSSKPAYRFSYVQPGVRGLADMLQVQVDDAATLDFTAKDGGQAINEITIDFEKGGGVLKGATLAAMGTLYLVNATKDLLNAPLPLVLEDLGNSDNIKSWKIVVNGEPKDRCIKYDAVSGKLSIVPNGLILLFR